MSASKESVGGWIALVAILLFILWELGQALWLGRMDDIFFDESDHLYFFEHPILFMLQFGAFGGFGYMIVRWMMKSLRARMSRK